MGTLRYDGLVVEFDDRLLMHLQIVMIEKIRRGESFLLSWRDDRGGGHAGSAAWIHPAQNLFFSFTGQGDRTINWAWLERMRESAGSDEGLRVMQEPRSARNDSSARSASFGDPDSMR